MLILKGLVRLMQEAGIIQKDKNRKFENLDERREIAAEIIQRFAKS
jgi:hypothetical protein